MAASTNNDPAGPGSGASPWWRQFFDPERYRVVLFDQRGCGRSLPNACDDVGALEHNTTADPLADTEQLREHLAIEQWLLFGASWGSTLGLAYAVEHPDRVSELVLWAVVTTRASDVAWLTHTMGQIYPQEYDELLASVPEARRVRRRRISLVQMGRPPFHPQRTRATGRRLPGSTAASWLRQTGHALPSQLPLAILEVVEADAHGPGDDTLDKLVKVLDEFAFSAPRARTPAGCLWGL